jgi:hypothetical protein
MKHLFTIIRHDIIQHLRSPMLWIVIVLSACVFVIAGYLPIANKHGIESGRSTANIGSPRYLLIDDSLNVGVPSIIRKVYAKGLRETFRTYYLVPESGANYIEQEDNSIIHVKISHRNDTVILVADVIQSEQSTMESLLIHIAYSVCELSGYPRYKVRFKEPQLQSIVTKKSNKIWLLIGLVSLYITLSGVYGQLILRSLYEERATRLLDVLLTTVSPKTLIVARFLSCNTLALLHITIWILILKTTLLIAGDTTPNSDLYKLCGFALYSVLVSTSLYQCISIIIPKENSAAIASYIISLFTTLPLLYLSDLLLKGQGLGIKVLSFIPFYTPIIEGCKTIISPDNTLDIRLLTLSLVWIAGLLYLSISRFRRLTENG